MSFRRFLPDLYDHGRVRVGPPGAVDDSERSAGTKVLADVERIVRADFPGSAPDLGIEVYVTRDSSARLVAKGDLPGAAPLAVFSAARENQCSVLLADGRVRVYQVNH